MTAWPLAIVSAGYGTWLARRESQRGVHELVWPVNAAPLIDGHVLQQAQLQWRGPLAFLHWRDAGGQLHRLAWWPDTLLPPARRELRLAAASCTSTRARASMAP